MKLYSCLKTICAVLLLLSVLRVSEAQLMLTPAGKAQGLSLTTFITGFPSISNGLGPAGVGFANGHVLVSDGPGDVRLFATDTDGQNVNNALTTHFYGFINAIGIAQLSGNLYMTQASSNDLIQINADGTFNHLVVGGFNHPVGVAADPFNGQLFVSDQFIRIYKVDPSTGTKTPFVNTQADGLSLSPDGQTLYAAGENGHILGYSVNTGNLVLDSGFIPGGIDGTAAGVGLFANEVFVNTNSGTLYEINLTTHSQTLIASGGSRGDFVTVDPTNDTLLITQTDRLLRLNGATFTTVPEPGVVPLLLSSVLFAGSVLLRRRYKQQYNPS